VLLLTQFGGQGRAGAKRFFLLDRRKKMVIIKTYNFDRNTMPIKGQQTLKEGTAA
jgi:hypothetical protein